MGENEITYLKDLLLTFLKEGKPRLIRKTAMLKIFKKMLFLILKIKFNKNISFNFRYIFF